MAFKVKGASLMTKSYRLQWMIINQAIQNSLKQVIVNSVIMEAETNGLKLFENHDVSFQDQGDIATYKYASEYTPSRNSTLADLVDKFVANCFKKRQDNKQLSLFFEELPIFLEQPGIKTKKKTMEGEFIATFLREVLIFLSFIEANTSFYQRFSQLYHKDCKLFIKWEEDTGETSLSNQKPKAKTIKRMIITIMTKPLEDSSLKQLNNKQEEEQLVQIFFDSILKNKKKSEESKKLIDLKSFVGVLKGKGCSYYILFLQQTLGTGGFGSVYRGQSVRINKSGETERKLWAVKCFKMTMKQYIKGGFSISQQREHQILLKLNNQMCKKELQAREYIIELGEVLHVNDRKYIIYEYCRHNSIKQFVKKNSFSKKNIYQIALQLALVLKAIHYDIISSQEDFLSFSVKLSYDQEIINDFEIHKKVTNPRQTQKGIIHRDLKLNNILIKQISDHHVVIKVIDWAFSKRTFTDLQINRTYCGTTQYQAPEIEDKKQYSSKVDVWAFGAIFYQLITRKQLIDKGRAKQIRRNFQSYIKDMKFSDAFQDCSEDEIFFWKKLLLGTLQYNAQKRWDAKNLLAYIQNIRIYQPVQPNDLRAIATTKQIKSLLFHLLTDSKKLLKGQSKLVVKGFDSFQRLLVELAEKLLIKQIEVKINLKNIQTQFWKRNYSFIEFKNIKYTDTKYPLRGCKQFIQKNLIQCQEKKQLLFCVQFLLDQYEVYRHKNHQQ